MFNNEVMLTVLGAANFEKWFAQQELLDERFFSGDMEERLYLLASMELLVEFVPKGENIRSLTYKYEPQFGARR